MTTDFNAVVVLSPAQNRHLLRTNKGEIQGSFTSFRMTAGGRRMGGQDNGERVFRITAGSVRMNGECSGVLED
jgi:hypothetical protein